jgi:hypothetical protein
MRRTVARIVEERLAWRWLRLQLTAELGVTFRPRRPGRPPALNKLDERKVIEHVSMTLRGSRKRVFRALSNDMGVSESTVRRVWLKSVRERAEAL